VPHNSTLQSWGEKGSRIGYCNESIIQYDSVQWLSSGVDPSSFLLFMLLIITAII